MVAKTNKNVKKKMLLGCLSLLPLRSYFIPLNSAEPVVPDHFTDN